MRYGNAQRLHTPVQNSGNGLDGLFPARPRRRHPPGLYNIGLGQREFFTTPTWSDLTLGTTLRAALGDLPCCAYITNAPCRRKGAGCSSFPRPPPTACSFFIPGVQARPAGASIPACPSARLCRFFYEGSGLFHAFKTCNSWTAGGLKAAGLPALPGPRWRISYSTICRLNARRAWRINRKAPGYPLRIYTANWFLHGLVSVLLALFWRLAFCPLFWGPLVLFSAF